MLAGRWVLLGCLLSPLARAETAPISIWYRNSESCPNGAAFLDRLEKLGRKASLAGAGDSIDFVVTLGDDGAKNFGRLERQTERGTVAIREVEAPGCAEVAEALALSLDLALEPQSPTALDAGSAPKRDPRPPPDPRAVPASNAEAEHIGTTQQRARPTADVADTQAPQPSAELARRRQVGVGAQAILATGIGPTPLLGGGVFGDLSQKSWPLSARVTGLVGFASSTVAGAALDFRLFALRLEGCPRGVVVLGASWSPCAATEFGVLSAQYQSQTGIADSGPWATAALHLRATWWSKHQNTLEAQVGAQMPLIRYDTKGSGEGEPPLARTAAVGFTAAVGGAFSLL